MSIFRRINVRERVSGRAARDVSVRGRPRADRDQPTRMRSFALRRTPRIASIKAAVMRATVDLLACDIGVDVRQVI